MEFGRARGGSARADHPALQRCAGLPAAQFDSRYWGRRALFNRTSGGGFDDLLSLASVDELLSRRGLRTPFLRIAKDGAVLDRAQFTGSGGAGAEIGDQVHDDRVARLFADGHTLVLQGLHRIWPPLIDFAANLMAEMSHPVQINAYVTPPSATGFSAHYDVHDVFVLQVAGHKRWLVHEPVHLWPLRHQPWTQHREAVAERAGEQPVLDHVLAPGDALYLPRGYLHSAQALSEVSAHLTVGVHVVTRYALVEALCALAADDEHLRAPLPLGFDAEHEFPAELAAVVDRLTTTMRDADQAVVAEHLQQQLAAGGRPEPVGPLEQAAAARELTPDRVVRARRHLHAGLQDEPGGPSLRLTERTITLPPATGPALKQLMSGEPMAVHELAGLDEQQQLALVRQLLHECVIVPVEVVGDE